jgi:Tol biopolymer transport system component
MHPRRLALFGFTLPVLLLTASLRYAPAESPPPAPIARPLTAPATERVSLTAAGAQAPNMSSGPAVSGDGRFVAFESVAALVPTDTNGLPDVYVRDRLLGTTIWASVPLTGTATGPSNAAAISADGRFVAFQSAATNLVPGDTNGAGDVFVRDLQTGTTERVSVDSAGTPGNGPSDAPSLSADGALVAFTSQATNLVAGDTNTATDVFVHDRRTGTTMRASVATGGTQAGGASYDPRLSADGRFVGFDSDAPNLVPGDTNGVYDVFLHDLQTGATERASLTAAGDQADGDSSTPSLSADGRFVAFQSYAGNLVAGDTNGNYDVFVRDRQTGAVERSSLGVGGVEGNAGAYEPSLSAGGQIVAFKSGSSNLVPGDNNGSADVFIRDRVTGALGRASLATDGTEGDADSGRPASSATGRYVAFESAAGNLVPGDSNGVFDVFLRDRSDAPPPSPTPTASPTVVPTATPPATATITPCPVTFSDVPPAQPFYPFIRCLACQGIVGGYSDGTFLPGANVTRGQVAKFVSNAAGFTDAIPASRQTFRDVAPDSTFWLFVERAVAHGVISGYDCGPGCLEFRPGAAVTRGQVAKFVANAAGFTDAIPPSRQTFADVPPANPFWLFIERTAAHGVVGGYSDGTFRPGAPVTRGQTSKFIANAFFSGCNPAVRTFVQ